MSNNQRKFLVGFIMVAIVFCMSGLMIAIAFHDTTRIVINLILLLFNGFNLQRNLRELQ